MRRVKTHGNRLVLSKQKVVRKPALIGGKISHLTLENDTFRIEDPNYTNLDRLKDSLQNLSIKTTSKGKKKYVQF